MAELSHPELLVWGCVVPSIILAWFFRRQSHFLDSVLHYFATYPYTLITFPAQISSLLIKILFFFAYRKLDTCDWAVAVRCIVTSATHNIIFTVWRREKILIACYKAVRTFVLLLVGLQRLTQDWHRPLKIQI